jgi:hypothetical protein
VDDIVFCAKENGEISALLKKEKQTRKSVKTKVLRCLRKIIPLLYLAMFRTSFL